MGQNAAGMQVVRMSMLLGAAFGPPAVSRLLGAAFGPPAMLLLIGAPLACRSAPRATTQPSPSTAQVPSAGAAPAARPHASRPQTKEACAACRGLWAVHGISEVESCICRTKDGGRPCREGGECEGECIADDARFEVVEGGPPPRGFYDGRCSDYDTTFGCYRVLPRGIRTRGPLRAEDAAEHICVD